MIKLSSTTKTLATGLGAVALSLGGLVLNAGSARSATITQTASITSSPTEWGPTTVTFNLFDTSVGTLNSVFVQMTGSVEGSGYLANLNGYDLNDGTYTLSATIELFDSTGTDSIGIVQPIYEDVLSDNPLAAGQTRYYGPTTLTTTANYSYYSGDSLLSYFTGTGVGTFLSVGSGYSGWLGDSNVTADFSTSAGVNYTVVYNYTTAVPEPLTILGAGVAAAFGAGFKRHSSKNSKNKNL